MNVDYLYRLNKGELKELGDKNQVKLKASMKKSEMIEELKSILSVDITHESLVYEQVVVIPHDLNYNKVRYLKLNTDDSKLKSNEKHINLSFVAYKIISNAILSNKSVFISSNIKTNEVQPWDILVSEGITIDDVRDSSISKIKTLLTPVISKVSGLSMYGFIVLNNELVSKGFAIYEGNREEVYLSILETGDEDLINKLEDYLNYKDEIERVSQLERQFTEIISSIKDANTVEDILKIETGFLETIIPQLK